MNGKDSQGFRYFKLIAKSGGLTLALVGVLIFLVHYLETYAEKIGLVIFVVGSLLWILATILSTIEDWADIKKEAQGPRQPK